ncbi:MAG: ATP-binding protein [Anaerolineae bacterium]|nr:ATP-binding protein [Thermoflexales bacterium]HQW36659.1 ATP-binding protein [Thermoflexales bacterium]
MARLFRRSLLVQLLGMYLGFVVALLGTGLMLRELVQRQLVADAEATNLALARSVAHEIGDRLLADRATMLRLMSADNPSPAALVKQAKTSPEAITQLETLLRDYLTASRDADMLYWLDEAGVMRVSVPEFPLTIGTDLSRQPGFVTAQTSRNLAQEFGLDRTTLYPVIVLAQPLYDASGTFLGVLGMNIPRQSLNAPIEAIRDEHAQRGEAVSLHILNEQGQLIATSIPGEISLERYPGALGALSCGECTVIGAGRLGGDWMFSAAPAKGLGWSVVAQREAQSAFASITSFNTFLLLSALFLTMGGLLFWMVLLRRVIRPLQTLAAQYLDVSAAAITPTPHPAADRADEMGDLARSLSRLESNVAAHIAELNMLLSTSRAVVSTLDPRRVCVEILHAARALVDVQAAAVLVPDEDRKLRVLVSEGHTPDYPRMVSISLDDPESPSARALRSIEPVQMVVEQDSGAFPRISFGEGFRAVLAIPIVGPHAGAVILLVHRNTPKPFSADEVNLLVTFANYATLAWEHAVLYERSDERLREIAGENKRLYRQALEDKQTLLSAVGHELRTPLAAIKGYASTLLQQDVAWTPDDQQHFLNTISNEADRMSELVSNLLDLSRQEAGLLALRRAEWDIRELVTRAIQYLKLPMSAVTLEIPSDLPSVFVDRQRIEVVLRNLIENAKEYGDGKIVVTATRAEGDALAGRVAISVMDDGPGIDPAEIPNLFERFYRARRGVQRRSGGTGLGLTICRAFVQAHGGEISISSDDNGTRVTFTLPLDVAR